MEFMPNLSGPAVFVKTAQAQRPTGDLSSYCNFALNQSVPALLIPNGNVLHINFDAST
jgi:hypothetical protein